MTTETRASWGTRFNSLIIQPDMQVVLQHAPEVRYLLLYAAQQSDARDRWQTYETLKTLASLRVGHYALHPDLRTSRCYEVVLAAIDRLLPDAGERTDER